MTDVTKSVDLPEWFHAKTPLTMDPLIGPDEQYRAGARDMLTVIKSASHRVGPGGIPTMWSEDIAARERAEAERDRLREFVEELATPSPDDLDVTWDLQRRALAVLGRAGEQLRTRETE